MRKKTGLLALLSIGLFTYAQPQKIKKDRHADSLTVSGWSDEPWNDLPVISLHEDIKTDDSYSFIPSLLTANRDVFMTTAAFHFNAVRFRMRGYDGEYVSTFVNGILMNHPEDGYTPWNLWSGLNDVTRNAQTFLGLRATDVAFGNIGNTSSIDIRAFKQRAQTQFSYAFSNRSFTNRCMVTHSRELNKKGWAFSLSASWRYGSVGYVAGTSYGGVSYFIGVDKKITNGKIISLVLFGASTNSGKQSANTEEMAQLLQTHYYNAYWGFQNGKKRNANMVRAHQPVLILTYDHRINNHSSLQISLGAISGPKSNTALDWYKAADPRPDYYRYLPGYQKDSVIRSAVVDAIKEQSSLQQVNWGRLYEVNRNSYETIKDFDGVTGNSFSGVRSHYILEERVSHLQRFDLNSVYNTTLSKGISFTGGISFQWQQTHHYKKINDLLGGAYYVDWNQFAENVYGNDQSVIQNDLNRPNRLLHAGDIYGYDYLVRTNLAKAWAQMVASKKRVDFFAAAEMSYTNYLRDGNMRNGLFPDNSFGRSRLHEFTNYAAKAGITYKINGRKYLYLYVAVLSKAPLFDNVFISPRTRDTEQESISSENIQSAEAGYLWNAPGIKLRLTGYLSRFYHGMNVTTFYHDGYRSFMNYALSGIDKLHFGTELGGEIKLSPQLSFTSALAFGRYYYNSRPQVTVSTDNDAYVTERGFIYSQNFRVAGTPQEAYSAGIAYQSSGSFYLNLTGSYFRQQWIEYNPLRRTYAALQQVPAGSEQWYRIINQLKLSDQYTVDLSAGSSMQLKLDGGKRKTLLFTMSISNLLNNRSIISGGYEQLRFDTDTQNVEKFSPKFFYAMGFNFSANLTLRL